MKRIVPLFILLFLLLPLSAQKVDFKINIISSTGNDNSDGKIEVTVQEGKAPFTFTLFDKKPWMGGNIIEKKEGVFERLIFFENLKPGTYFILVEDDTKENPSGITVELKVEKSDF